jgi:tetratricopeptide (TPR) repeat protein
VVRTRKILVQRIARDYRASARFERLFLSGGSEPNAKAARTERGKAAERAFFGACAPDERERLVLEALRENPGDKVLWNLYGRLLQNKKDWLGARICFRNALRLDREYQFALTNLALTYQAMGRRELAVAAAIVAYGVATDGWCKSQSEGVLKAK